jgi:GH25 family lysozyme M1 (1,4-beta-N-acetylmuramidase)
MDSNLRRKAILVGTICIFAIILVAVITNFEALQRRTSEQIENDIPDMSEDGFRISEELTEAELRAFVKDPTFFDEEEGIDLEAALAKSLSISVLSVEKDLRIRIMDVAGRLVTGEEFQITVDGVGTYEDDNTDGIIYIPSLNAGEYYVQLEDYDGYKVPDSTIKVNVKSSVEYLEIEDIAYFIQSEDDIDAAKEDSSVNMARSEADGTETKIKMLPEGAYYFGIDVSKWNREIDWEEVSNAGVDFAIIRCGYRGSVTGALVEDPYFEKNIQGALAAGIDVGVYFFTQATTAVEAVEEASMVLTLVEDYNISYPIFIDTESAGGEGRADDLSRADRTTVCDAFCRTIASADEEYTAGVYASKNWFNTKVDDSRFAGRAIWLAQYSENPTYAGDYHMWQYTSRGSIDGISGNVDFNLSYMKKE